MKSLADWFDRRAKVVARRPEIAEVLIGRSAWPYFSHRLRYFLLHQAFFVGLHLCETLLLYHIFSIRNFFAILIIKNCCFFGRRFWWGYLESMREDIRRAREDRAFSTRDGSLARGFGFTLTLATILIVVACGHFAWTTWVPRHILSVFDLYAIFAIARLALDMIRDSLHSGIYALRRVYRPVWVSMSIDAAALGLTVVLFTRVGPWAFPWANIVAGIATFCVSLYFIRRAYYEAGLGLPRWRLRLPRISDLPASLTSGMGNALFQSASLFMTVALLKAMQVSQNAEDRRFLFFLYLCRPFISLCHEWGQLIYFDYKRIFVQRLDAFRHRFDRAVFQVSIAMGLLAWAGCVLISFLLPRWPGVNSVLLLSIFLLSRTLLGNLQVRSFAYGQMRGTLVAGIFEVAGLAVYVFSTIQATHTLIYFSFLQIAVAGVLYLFGRERVSKSRVPREVSVETWIHELAKARGPVRLGFVKVGANDMKVGVGRAMRAFDSHFSGPGHTAATDRFTFIWYRELSAMALPPERLNIARCLKGLAEECAVVDYQASGSLAVREAVRRNWVNPLRASDIDDSTDTGANFSAQSLRRQFARDFPDGMCLTAKSAHAKIAGTNPLDAKNVHALPKDSIKLSPAETANLLVNAQRFIQHKKPIGQAPRFEVTASSDNGAVVDIFLINSSAPADLRLKWRNVVRRLNRQQAIEATGEMTPAPAE